MQSVFEYMANLWRESYKKAHPGKRVPTRVALDEFVKFADNELKTNPPSTVTPERVTLSDGAEFLLGVDPVMGADYSAVTVFQSGSRNRRDAMSTDTHSINPFE